MVLFGNLFYGVNSLGLTRGHGSAGVNSVHDGSLSSHQDTALLAARAIPGLDNDIASFHRTVTLARRVVEDTDGMAEVPKKELQEVLDKIKDLEAQVSAMMKTGGGGEAATNDAKMSGSTGTNQGTAGTNDDCSVERLLLHVGRRSLTDGSANVSDHPFFKRTNCDVKSIAAAQNAGHPIHAPESSSGSIEKKPDASGTGLKSSPQIAQENLPGSGAKAANSAEAAKSIATPTKSGAVSNPESSLKGSEDASQTMTPTSTTTLRMTKTLTITLTGTDPRTKASKLANLEKFLQHGTAVAIENAPATTTKEATGIIKNIDDDKDARGTIQKPDEDKDATGIIKESDDDNKDATGTIDKPDNDKDATGTINKPEDYKDAPIPSVADMPIPSGTTAPIPTAFSAAVSSALSAAMQKPSENASSFTKSAAKFLSNSTATGIDSQAKSIMMPGATRTSVVPFMQPTPFLAGGAIVTAASIVSNDVTEVISGTPASLSFDVTTPHLSAPTILNSVLPANQTSIVLQQHSSSPLMVAETYGKRPQVTPFPPEPSANNMETAPGAEKPNQRFVAGMANMTAMASGKSGFVTSTRKPQ